MSGKKRVFAQTCVNTHVCGQIRVWAQTYLGTNMCGHKRVWAHKCLGTIVWAQACMGTNVGSSLLTQCSIFENQFSTLHHQELVELVKIFKLTI